MSSTSAGSPASRCYSASLDGLNETINYDLLISSVEPPDSRSASATSTIARCIAIIDKPLDFLSQKDFDTQESPQSTVDTALVIFPPSVLPGGSGTTAAHVFVTGEGSMSAPKGNCTSCPCRYQSDIIRSDDLTRDFVLVDPLG